MTDYTPYQRHSVTSEGAAEQIKDTATTQKQKVLAYIVGCGCVGATDEEIQRGLCMNPSTQRPRRIDLAREGHITDSGDVRMTTSKRKAVVWVAVQFSTIKRYASLDEYHAAENAMR